MTNDRYMYLEVNGRKVYELDTQTRILYIHAPERVVEFLKRCVGNLEEEEGYVPLPNPISHRSAVIFKGVKSIRPASTRSLAEKFRSFMDR